MQRLISLLACFVLASATPFYDEEESRMLQSIRPRKFQGMCNNPKGKQLIQARNKDYDWCTNKCASLPKCKSFIVGEGAPQAYTGTCEIYDQEAKGADGNSGWSCYVPEPRCPVQDGPYVKVLKKGSSIPKCWQEMTLQDYNSNQKVSRSLISEWGVVDFKNGQITGSGNGNKITKGKTSGKWFFIIQTAKAQQTDGDQAKLKFEEGWWYGLVCICCCCIGGLVGGGLFWRKKRNSGSTTTTVVQQQQSSVTVIQPGMMQMQPGMMPMQPGMMPMQPGMMPMQPQMRPMQPGMMPMQPGMMQPGMMQPGMPQQMRPGGF